MWMKNGCWNSVRIEVVKPLHEIWTGTWLISFRKITGGHVEIDHIRGDPRGGY